MGIEADHERLLVGSVALCVATIIPEGGLTSCALAACGCGAAPTAARAAIIDGLRRIITGFPF
jgi:hypothetical protein